MKRLTSPVKSGMRRRSGGASWLTHSDEYALALLQVADSYSSLGHEARLLDRHLFQTLITVVRGRSLQLLLALKGDAQRYTYGIIALWKHAEIGASNRCIPAMAAMHYHEAVKFQGDSFRHGSVWRWRSILQRTSPSGISDSPPTESCSLSSYW